MPLLWLSVSVRVFAEYVQHRTFAHPLMGSESGVATGRSPLQEGGSLKDSHIIAGEGEERAHEEDEVE